MSYSGQTHQIPCNAGGLNGTANEELLDASMMVHGSKNLNLVDGGRQKRGGTAKINGSNILGRTALTIFATDHTANPDTVTIATAHGDKTSLFAASSTFVIAGSTANDGTYTVTSSSWDGTNTIIVVTEALTDSAADGTATPSAAPEINGLYDFMPAGGTAYIVLTDDLGNIYSRPQTIIHTGWTADKYPSFEQFNDVLYMCNGRNIPQVWTGAAYTTATTDIGSGGISVPGALTAAVSGSGSGIALDLTAYTWKVTFVNAHGETSGGTVSTTVTPIATDDQVDLTDIPLGDRKSVV